MKKVVTFGEIMLRLSAPGYQRFIQSTSLNATFGGGEANVAVSLSNYGIPTDYVTRLPENDIAEWCISDLRKYNVGVQNIIRGGDRVGIYYLETGAVARASKVIYDRANSAMADIKPGMIGWEEVFKDPVLTTAIIDRMAHKSHIIDLSGKSYRAQETLK